MSWETYKVDVPAGRSGDWSIESFAVSVEDARIDFMRARMRGSDRFATPGNYTRLKQHGNTIMSDTHDEITDHLPAIRNASGHVLINGLGLGMMARACAMEPSVESVTVIELSTDVINLVLPHYRAQFSEDRLLVVHADAFTFRPPSGKHYGMVWHDIWPSITSDNLPEMATLHRRYAKRSSWQGSWCRDQCRRLKRSEGRDDRFSRFDRFGGLLGLLRGL